MNARCLSINDSTATTETLADFTGSVEATLQFLPVRSDVAATLSLSEHKGEQDELDDEECSPTLLFDARQSLADDPGTWKATCVRLTRLRKTCTRQTKEKLIPSRGKLVSTQRFMSANISVASVQETDRYVNNGRNG